MDTAERERQRAGILTEVEGLLREAFALEAWGRLLVFVARADEGTLHVSDLQVEEILDDAAVERAFEGADARGALGALSSAVEALTLLDELEVDELLGGTFVRNDEGVAWLAGCVRTPSAGFDARRDSTVARATAQMRDLEEQFDIGSRARIESDMVLGTFSATVGGECSAVGKQIVIGSFSKRRRSWVWGAHNPTLANEARRRSAEALDQISDRSMWEISTPGFMTDEATAWALAALVADERKLQGLVRVDTADGFVLLGLTEIRRPD